MIQATLHCNTLQHAATHCSTLQYDTMQHTEPHKQTWFRQRCTATHCNTLQHTATHCNTLQHTATLCNIPNYINKHDSGNVAAGTAFAKVAETVHFKGDGTLCHVVVHCHTHCKTHCNALPHCTTSRLEYTATHYNTLKFTLQRALHYIATQCNILQRTATHRHTF